MKTFLLKYGLFALLFFGLAYLVQEVVDYGLKRMTAHTATQTSISELLSDSLNADILIMGNSRALCSYHSQVIETITGKRVWNIGVSGQPFGISYMRYQLYAQHNKTPQLVIINIDQGELDIIANGFGREEYYPYFDQPIIQSYFDLYGLTWKHRFIPMYKYFGDYKLIGYGFASSVGIYPFDEKHHYHGFYNENSPFDGTNLRKKFDKDSIIVADCNSRAVQLLEDLIVQLQQQNTNVLFCYAPQYQVLFQQLNLDDMMIAYKELSNTYEVPLLDYSCDYWTNDSSYFYNANHINLKGATLFSTQLANDIQAYLVP